MNIKNNGLFIEYNNLGELDEAMRLVCNCGHELYQHAFTTDYIATLTTSQCVMCGTVDNKFRCERFTYNDRK